MECRIFLFFGKQNNYKVRKENTRFERMMPILSYVPFPLFPIVEALAWRIARYIYPTRLY